MVYDLIYDMIVVYIYIYIIYTDIIVTPFFWGGICDITIIILLLVTPR